MIRTLPAAHLGSRADELRIARIADRTLVLGPGARCVVWVQGCALRCRGCVVPESHAIGGGVEMTPEALADRLLGAAGGDGVTFSGGEPFLQARGLAQAIQLLRRARPDWTFMSYSGYREETIRSRGSDDQRTFLDELDLLVDGPYVERLAARQRWRGSSNQRIRALTAAGTRAMAGLDDSAQGIEVEIGTDGVFAWTGVPPAGFRTALDAAFARAGLILEQEPGTPADADRRDRTKGQSR